MDIVVAGGHGQVARHLLRMLAARGDRALGLIRNPDHAGDLERLGAQPVVCDLEREDPRPHVDGVDAIVFAAGAGPGSGPARKRTVDFGAAKKLVEAAEEVGVRRYVMVSSMGTRDIAGAHEGMRPYLQAKADADDVLRASALEWTIVKPGGLTNDAGTRRIEAAEALGRSGQIPREDVAAVIVACLLERQTVGAEFELLAGDTPIEDALRHLAGGRRPG